MKFTKALGWLAAVSVSVLLTCATARAEDDTERLWKQGKVKTRPKPLKQPQPEYPERMSRSGLIGNVIVDFIIDEEGQIQNPVVVQSNNPWFERPAIVAILKWKFAPAEVDGRKVKTRARQEIKFDLWGSGQTPWEITNRKAKKHLPAEFQWDLPPVPLNTAYPVYPFAALQAGLKGKTKIIYMINTTGEIIETKLQEATTPELGQAVLAMIETWRFKPARKLDGTPMAALFGMEHEFTPGGDRDVPVSDEAQDILHDLKKNPGAIVALGELDQAPKPLSRRPPAYPLALQKAGQSGEAVIEFFIDKNGDAQLPRIVSSSAPEFGYAAVQAVATWRFEAPKKKGKPVVVRAQIPVGFSPVEKKPAQLK